MNKGIWERKYTRGPDCPKDPRVSCMFQIVRHMYTAGMLVQDLLEAGMTVFSVEYDEDADCGMKMISGVLPPEEFLREYDHINSCGWGDMSYLMECEWDGIEFSINYVKETDPRRLYIVVIYDPSVFPIDAFLRKLEKD